ncbi:MAG TPA: hypothetical protein VGN38_11625 [Caulobacteraceae bacterium]|nr:hypothetical protein [Caulobacteraceae bacterium]
MGDRPWFKVRASGLGWTPITWEGWLITLASMALVLAANFVFLAHLGVFRR